MSADDPFVQHLSTLAGTTPHVAVDRRRVLQAGRRRRVLRASGATAVTLVGVVGLYGGVAALQPRVDSAPPAGQMTTGSTPEPTGTAAVRAVVDESAGTIGLPLDAWTMSKQDVAVMETAVDLAVSRCMADAGFAEYAPFAGPVTPGRGTLVDLGVWLRAEVEQDGYAGVLDLAEDAPGRGVAFTDAARDAHRACSLGALEQGLTYEPGDVEGLAPVGYSSALSTDAGKAVRADWVACLQANGIAPPDEDASMIPSGALDAPLAEQVRIGTVDLGCKDETDTVQRMADVAAAEQLAYIERGRDYLTARHAVEVEVLRKDRAYLDAAGVLMTDG